jgi:murein DD-endopeptidase MepM/ murein hydrolase activator NlpD
LAAPLAANPVELDHCPEPVEDRTGDSLREIFDSVGLQAVAKDGHPWFIGRKRWTYPTGVQDAGKFRGFGVISTPLEKLNGGHEGVDVAGRRGDPVYAAAKGEVAYLLTGCPDGKSRWCGNGWGNHVVIAHGDGVFTRYAHLQSVGVKIGQAIERGTPVGELGNSGLSDGPHLHFELGTRRSEFEPCSHPQNFDRVYDPKKLVFRVGN